MNDRNIHHVTKAQLIEILINSRKGCSTVSIIARYDLDKDILRTLVANQVTIKTVVNGGTYQLTWDGDVPDISGDVLGLATPVDGTPGGAFPIVGNAFHCPWLKTRVVVRFHYREVDRIAAQETEVRCEAN